MPDEKFKQYVLDWDLRGKHSNPDYPTVDMSVDIVDWQEMMHYTDDALGVCAGLSTPPVEAPVPHTRLPGFISSGAGVTVGRRGPEDCLQAEP